MGGGPRVALVVAVGVAVGGCRGDPTTGPARAGPLRARPSASAEEAPPPVDHTRDGEVAEGRELAFGLRLPRDARVLARFDDSVHARGPLGLEPTANYVRARVRADRIDTGPAKTVFAGAKPKGDPERVVRVEVIALDREVEIIVRDETPKPAEPDVSPAEWMRRSGLNPDGSEIERLAE